MKFFLVVSLAFLGLMSAECWTDGFLNLTPCTKYDTVCLTKYVREFLSQTCHGRAGYDLKTIDPLVIDSLELEVTNDFGTILYILHYKNLNITGLQNQEITDFKHGTQTKLLETKADLNIVGDVTVELVGTAKSFSGHFTLKETASTISIYEFIIKADSEGEDHYEIGSIKSISCQTLNDPEFTFEAELTQVTGQDEFVKDKMELFKSIQLQKLIFCEIVKEAYVSVIHNIRIGARIIPKSGYIKS